MTEPIAPAIVGDNLVRLFERCWAIEFEWMGNYWHMDCHARGDKHHYHVNCVTPEIGAEILLAQIDEKGALP